MREYAVYANEDGVPKLERGDSPAKDPQIIQDSPIPTATPKAFHASPIPTSDADSSAAQPSSTPLSSEQAAVTVSDNVTGTSTNNATPTISDVGSTSPSVKPSASTSPTMAPASPGPFPHSSPSSEGVPVGAVGKDLSDSDPFDDDLDLSATADEYDVESETNSVSDEQHFDSQVEGATQPLAAEPVAVPEQSVASGNVFKPVSSSLSGEQAPTIESSKPSHDEEEEPFESPLFDDTFFNPTPMKTAAPPGKKKEGNVEHSSQFNSKAPVQFHLQEDPPAQKPEPSQFVSPLPSPVQPHLEGESSTSENHPVLDTSMLEEDDQFPDSSLEDEVTIADDDAVPVAVETEGSDEPVSHASTAAVTTAIPPSTSNESPASTPTVTEGASNEAHSPDVAGNVEVDESFTCTYFGKGSIPHFEKPDENNFTGDVSTFAVGVDEFPELASQYLSHVHGTSWSYSFSVDDSFAYDVVLGFAEVYDAACKAGEGSGYRIFNTWVGDQTTKIDVMAIVGCGKPLQKVYPKIKPSGNTITMVFKQVSQHAMLSTMCYRQAGALNSKSPVTELKPSPVQESNHIATAIPPVSPEEGEISAADEQPGTSPEENTKPTATDSKPGSTYKCVNFGLEGVNGYEMYKRNSVSGDAHVFAGSGQLKNALPEPYWYYMYGQDWSYSLEVSSSNPQNLVLGYAETSADACDMDRQFTVSANGGIQTVNVTEKIECGVMYQTELEGVIPVDGIIDLSFTAMSGEALISVLCYADVLDSKTSTIGTIEPIPDVSSGDAVDGSSTSPEAKNEPTLDAAQNDSLEEAGNGGSCFSFGQSNIPGFLNTATLPLGVSYYASTKVHVSGAPDKGSVFSSHIFGSHFSLTISNNDQAPKSVFIGLAEIYEPACNQNQRLFSVTIGSLTKTIDVAEEVGCSTALILRIDEVIPDDAGDIVIGFSAVKDNAMVSAVCVTESVGNSFGKPSTSLVSKLPPLSMLSNSATVSIASEESKSVETPVPSPTVVIVGIPSASGADVDEVEDQTDGILNTDEIGDGNPKGSPFPEVNGLIDATITESPALVGSDVATSPLSGSDENVESGNPVLGEFTNDSQEGEVHSGDILLPTDFSQTTFGETPVVVSTSPIGVSSSEAALDAPMHPTGPDSDGFPQSAAVEDVESKQSDDASSSESSEVIVVLEENALPSSSPSATSRPAQNVGTGTNDDEIQTVQPSSSPAPIPTPGVIIIAQEKDPAEQSPSPSETTTPSTTPDSGVLISVDGGGEEQESSTTANEPFSSSPEPDAETTLAVEQEASSQDSQSSATAEPSTSGSAVIIVSEVEDPLIPTTPEDSTVAIMDIGSDADDEPIPSSMPLEEDLDSVLTAIPPASGSTGPGSDEEGSSNDSKDSVIVALGSDPTTVSMDPQPSLSITPAPVSVAIPPIAATEGTRNDENDEVQILVPDGGETPGSASSSSENGAVIIPVDATEISSLQPSPSTTVAIAPAATVTNNQIEIVISDTPTATPSASSSGDEVQDVVIIDGETSDASSVEAPDGVSLGGVASDGSSLNVDGATSASPSPSPSLIVSVTGSDTVIIGSTGAEASPIPASSVVPVAAPEAVAEVPDDDADVIQVSETENTDPVDSSALTGDENVPSIIEGEYKELIGTVSAGSGFSIGMGVLGALLVLLLLVLLFFAIRSDGVAYSYSSQYSSRKPSDYGDASQGGYTEGLNQGAGIYQDESYAGNGASGYASGQPPMESRPIDGSENFAYERPEDGLGGASGSYGNVGPDTYAAYSSLNLQDAPTTIDNETNMYTQSATMTAEGVFHYGSGTRDTTFSGTRLRESEQATEYGASTTHDQTEIASRAQSATMTETGGHMLHYGSGTRDTTFSGTRLRESEQPTEYGEATTYDHTEIVSHGDAPTTMQEDTLPGASEFEQRISMFGGRRGSHRTPSGQDTREGNSFHDNRSVARPNFESASSGNQGREYGMALLGTGYETVTKEEREQYNVMQARDLEKESPETMDSRIGGGPEDSERILSMSSTPTAAPSPYETDMQGQLGTDSDSGNVSYQYTPVLASEFASAASADVRRSRVLRRARNDDIHKDSVLDDYQHNESSVRESARHGHGTMELQSDLSNDGPWPWWWSDQKDQKGIFEESAGPSHAEPELYDKENSSLPSNNQSPVEQSSSGLSTEDAKAAVAVADTMILKPSEIARLGHLPTSASKWQRQYSSTSDGTSRERFENNPYFDELRKRREPYVKNVANRLSTGVKAYSKESGESLLEQARKEFEEEHSQQPSLEFNGNDPSSWVTQGVEV
ncbi:hypothetical protein FGB62_64g127 [Gracilaria domingensis]|nr:hypothetical protein FGB62_64g127 [Gracilaria domingensis]